MSCNRSAAQSGVLDNCSVKFVVLGTRWVTGHLFHVRADNPSVVVGAQVPSHCLLTMVSKGAHRPLVRNSLVARDHLHRPEPPQQQHVKSS